MYSFIILIIGFLYNSIVNETNILSEIRKENVSTNMNHSDQIYIEFFVSLDGCPVPCYLDENVERLKSPNKELKNILIDVNNYEVECIIDSKGLFIFFMSDIYGVPIFRYTVIEQAIYYIFENTEEEYVYFYINENNQLTQKTSVFYFYDNRCRHYVSNDGTLLSCFESERKKNHPFINNKAWRTDMSSKNENFDNKEFLIDDTGSRLRFFTDHLNSPYTCICLIEDKFYFIFKNQKNKKKYFNSDSDSQLKLHNIKNNITFIDLYKSLNKSNQSLIDIYYLERLLQAQINNFAHEECKKYLKLGELQTEDNHIKTFCDNMPHTSISYEIKTNDINSYCNVLKNGTIQEIPKKTYYDKETEIRKNTMPGKNGVEIITGSPFSETFKPSNPQKQNNISTHTHEKKSSDDCNSILEIPEDHVFYKNIGKIYLDSEMKILLDKTKGSGRRFEYIMHDINQSFDFFQNEIFHTVENMEKVYVNNYEKPSHSIDKNSIEQNKSNSFVLKRKLSEKEIDDFEKQLTFTIIKTETQNSFPKNELWAFMDKIYKTESYWKVYKNDDTPKKFIESEDNLKKFKQYKGEKEEYSSFEFYKYNEIKTKNSKIRSGIIAIGKNVSIEKIKFNGAVIVCENSTIEPGVILNNGVYVGPNCRIQKGCLIGTGCYLEEKVTIFSYTLIKNKNYFHVGSNIGKHYEKSEDKRDFLKNSEEIKSTKNLYQPSDTIIGSGNIFGRFCILYKGSHVYFYNYIGKSVVINRGAKIYMNNIIRRSCVIGMDTIIGIGNIIAKYVVLKERSKICLYNFVSIFNQQPVHYFMRGCNEIKCYMRLEVPIEDNEVKNGQKYKVSLSSTIIKNFDDFEKIIKDCGRIMCIKRIYILLDDVLDIRTLI